ncbi:putative metal-binding integral membrane protein [Blastochloris viridis]|uniref:Putative metal-binding integral membrane protein n=1 Tax=Blastochloris viridis TaxID=1079 RepID=A0A0S4Q3Z4_BLAVI|nr:putative metal-binding integral membrane protein [Blastochloris viridis]
MFARPRRLAVAAIVVLAVLGWAYMLIMVAGMAESGEATTLGPGMALFDRLLNPATRDELGRALLASLCQPGMSHFGMPGAAVWGLGDFALVVLMWGAMVFAMMLPTAAPMILTYAEIADTAAAKGQPVVSPLVIAAGYLAVWMLAALTLGLAQWGLTAAALLDPAMASVSGLFSGAVFLLAGAYQFTSLKYACVTACQRPFPFFLARWTTTRGGVFRLGVRQGLLCLGCCWALMAVMFAVGVMNLVWMAGLGVVMLIEKVVETTRFSRAIGAVLIAAGVAIVGTEVWSHWPRAA